MASTCSRWPRLVVVRGFITSIFIPFCQCAVPHQRELIDASALVFVQLNRGCNRFDSLVHIVISTVLLTRVTSCASNLRQPLSSLLSSLHLRRCHGSSHIPIHSVGLIFITSEPRLAQVLLLISVSLRSSFRSRLISFCSRPTLF